MSVNSSWKSNLPLYIGALILSIIFFYPLYVLILITFVPAPLNNLSPYPPQIPPGFTFYNIIQAYSSLNLTGPVTRSFYVAMMVGGLSIALGIPAAYGLNKIGVRTANKFIIFFFLINMMPGIVVAIPISVEFLKLGLSNIYGVALAQELVVLPLSIFIILGGFRALPSDLENQARVDGANLPTTMYRILIPMNRSAILVAFLLSWMTSWDEFTYAVIISPVKSTFPVQLYNYVTRAVSFEASAFALTFTIPVIIVAVVLQKYLKSQSFTGGLSS